MMWNRIIGRSGDTGIVRETVKMLSEIDTKSFYIRFDNDLNIFTKNAWIARTPVENFA